MNEVFRPFIDDFVMLYLDSILIYSFIWKDNIMHVKKVLDVLKREKLCVNMSKCEFIKTSLVYLAYVVGVGQLKVDLSKAEVVFNWPKLKIVIDIRIFLGTIQYWRKFIANLSYITSPLHALTSVKYVF
jgi:hypothetical protein